MEGVDQNWSPCLLPEILFVCTQLVCQYDYSCFLSNSFMCLKVTVGLQTLIYHMDNWISHAGTPECHMAESQLYKSQCVNDVFQVVFMVRVDI